MLRKKNLRHLSKLGKGEYSFKLDCFNDFLPFHFCPLPLPFDLPTYSSSCESKSLLISTFDLNSSLCRLHLDFCIFVFSQPGLEAGGEACTYEPARDYISKEIRFCPFLSVFIRFFITPLLLPNLSRDFFILPLSTFIRLYPPLSTLTARLKIIQISCLSYIPCWPSASLGLFRKIGHCTTGSPRLIHLPYSPPPICRSIALCFRPLRFFLTFICLYVLLCGFMYLDAVQSFNPTANARCDLNEMSIHENILLPAS